MRINHTTQVALSHFYFVKVAFWRTKCWTPLLGINSRHQNIQDMCPLHLLLGSEGLFVYRPPRSWLAGFKPATLR